MLIELRIKNYAVIEDLTLELGPGLNVVTGETGAGKSIVVGALGLLLGGRASSDAVRAGADRATIEGVFDVPEGSGLPERLSELGIDAEDGYLILRREVRAEGRSRAWAGGSPTTAAVLGEVGQALVDMHGQHDHQRLLAPSFQRDVLDAYAGAEDTATRVRQLHGQVVDLRGRLAALAERRRELESRGDYLRFQLAEIDSAGPRSGEETEIATEMSRLENAEELSALAQGLHEALYAADMAVAERLSSQLGRLRRLAELDPTLATEVAALQDAYHVVSDVGRALGDYGANVDEDPMALQRLRERQSVLQGLKRKYGATIDEVLASAERLRGELSELESVDLDADALTAQVEAALAELRTEAAELSAKRADAAPELARRAGDLFPLLGMEGGGFVVRLDPADEPGPGGSERVEFMASLNPGFPPAPLRRIASGGELSRVMLALKSVLAAVDVTPTLVFDEIDAGIGGVIGTQVGDRLSAVAGEHQVLVVTHLAQIACRATLHLHVEKLESDGIAATRLRSLSDESRVREIARMLGGDPDRAESLEHARQLLASADRAVELDRTG